MILGLNDQHDTHCNKEHVRRRFNAASELMYREGWAFSHKASAFDVYCVIIFEQLSGLSEAICVLMRVELVPSADRTLR